MPHPPNFAPNLAIGSLLLLIGMLVSGAPAGLQEDLQITQKRHLERRADVTISLRRLYLERLKDLEGQAVAHADYELAQKYRAEADEVRNDLGEHAQAPFELALYAEEAQLEGGLQLTADPDPSIVGWRPGARATWQLPAIPKGGYAVRVVHGEITAPLEFQLTASHYHVKGPLVVTEGEENTLNQAISSLGNLRITDERPKLTLTLSSDGQVNATKTLPVQRIYLESHAP